MVSARRKLGGALIVVALMASSCTGDKSPNASGTGTDSKRSGDKAAASTTDSSPSSVPPTTVPPVRLIGAQAMFGEPLNGSLTESAQQTSDGLVVLSTDYVDSKRSWSVRHTNEGFVWTSTKLDVDGFVPSDVFEVHGTLFVFGTITDGIDGAQGTNDRLGVLAVSGPLAVADAKPVAIAGSGPTSSIYFWKMAGERAVALMSDTTARTTTFLTSINGQEWTPNGLIIDGDDVFGFDVDQDRTVVVLASDPNAPVGTEPVQTTLANGSLDDGSVADGSVANGALGDTVPGEAVSGETVPGGTVPGGSVSRAMELTSFVFDASGTKHALAGLPASVADPVIDVAANDSGFLAFVYDRSTSTAVTYALSGDRWIPKTPTFKDTFGHSAPLSFFRSIMGKNGEWYVVGRQYDYPAVFQSVDGVRWKEISAEYSYAAAVEVKDVEITFLQDAPLLWSQGTTLMAKVSKGIQVKLPVYAKPVPIPTQYRTFNVGGRVFTVVTTITQSFSVETIVYEQSSTVPVARFAGAALYGYNRNGALVLVGTKMVPDSRWQRSVNAPAIAVPNPGMTKWTVTDFPDAGFDSSDLTVSVSSSDVFIGRYANATDGTSRYVASSVNFSTLKSTEIDLSTVVSADAGFTVCPADALLIMIAANVDGQLVGHRLEGERWVPVTSETAPLGPVTLGPAVGPDGAEVPVACRSWVRADGSIRSEITAGAKGSYQTMVIDADGNGRIEAAEQSPPATGSQVVWDSPDTDVRFVFDSSSDSGPWTAKLVVNGTSTAPVPIELGPWAPPGFGAWAFEPTASDFRLLFANGEGLRLATIPFPAEWKTLIAKAHLKPRR